MADFVYNADLTQLPGSILPGSFTYCTRFVDHAQFPTDTAGIYHEKVPLIDKVTIHFSFYTGFCGSWWKAG